MKATFVCVNPQTLREVYAGDAVERIRELAELDDTVCTPEELISGSRDLRDIEVLFSTWGMPSLTEEQIKTLLPSLKAVFYAAGTVQAFARPFLRCGVRVFSAWAANAIPVAEYTVAQILLANKGFFATSRRMAEASYDEGRRLLPQFPGNYDTAVGIVGAGMIGKKVIELLRPFRLTVQVFDPFLPDDTAAALGVTKTDLVTLFRNCQVVSNHLANNDRTKGMLRYEHFATLPQNATFLNTGRGAQVVEPDLCRVLAERPDLTAILDVTEPEPPCEGSPLYTLPNCILSPHIAGSSGNEVRRMAAYMIEELKALETGLSPRYEVTEAMLATMA